MTSNQPRPRRSERLCADTVIERTVASETEAFIHATSEVATLLPAPQPRAVPQRLPVLVAPGSPSRLLLDFVRDLLMLAETEAFFVRRVERIMLTEGLRAAVSGQIGRGPPVILVCRHASLVEVDDGWRMRIVLRHPASCISREPRCEGGQQ